MTENECHDDPDPNAKCQREDQARNRQVGANHTASVNEGENVCRGRKEKEGDGRPNPRAFFINPGKERHNRAGTDRQHRINLGMFLPRKRVTVSLGIKAVIAPAMQKAGKRHNRTCAARYEAKLASPLESMSVRKLRVFMLCLVPGCFYV